MLKLKDLRSEKGVYQKDIANLVSKTIACVSDWENGNTEPSIAEILKIADYFEVSTDYLLGRQSDIGIVEVQHELTADQEEMLKIYNRLSSQDKSQLLALAKRFLS